jgi:protoporphyrinogen oxidase
MAAYMLEKKVPGDCAVTIFEASDRVGGKVITGGFQASTAPFEEGVAELYDYSRIGPDPLRQLIKELGLKTIPMRGKAVVLDGRVLRNRSDILLAHGKATLRAIDEFYARARG